ncbi:alpha/beta fold hydrolase [Leekyejoonella antrihumi]|uniref:alpha/beta fold hydrolase n=1 Tax=Leekyejoonella antrihumi TaxID=1660198 RepID=UPI001FEB28DB|nr:alpha/beta hydrolase [Leekyejoonella antrihumi]
MNSGSVIRPDDAVIAHQVAGVEDGPWLLLLQGQANSHHWWDGIREDLGQVFRTVTFDYRGTGETTAPESMDAGWSTGLFAEDAVALLDELGIRRAHVYGTSMGGRVAQVLAAQHPERVGGLVLACTTPGGVHALERSNRVRQNLADPDARRRRDALLDLMYTPAWFTGDLTSNLLGDPGMTALAARLHLRVSARHDAYDLLPSISSPTLILHGDADQMAPVENAQVIADRVPHATVRIRAGGRHGFFDEFKDEVNSSVIQFLNP